MSLNLSRIRLIAGREWSQKVHERSFIITTVIQIVVVLALVLAPLVLSAIFGDEGEETDVAVVRVVNLTDSDTLTDDLAAAVGQPGQEAQIVFSEAPADVTPATLLEEGGADGVLIVDRNDTGALEFLYTNEDGADDQAAVLTYSAISNLALQNNLQEAGIAEQEVREVLAPPAFQVVSLEGEVESNDTEQGFRYVIAYLSAVSLYIVMLVYGMWVAQGVVVEKSSRIMEIMINAAPPTDLMFGKIIGIGLAGLTQIVPMLVVAVAGLLSQRWLADAFGVTGIDLEGIDFGAISVTLGVFFLTYFLLGFLLYSALYAGAGSLVSRQEDVQTVMTPMTFAVIAGFFGALFTLNAPDSIVAQVVSIVPFTSPMAMVPRILLGDPAAWEIVLSLGLLVLTGYLAVLLAARIYRMGVLMYGQKPSLKVIFQRDMIKAAR